MPDQYSPVRELEQKLFALREKIILHQSLGKAIAADFESLTSSFESLKQKIGSTSSEFGTTSEKFESTSSDFDSTSKKTESTSQKFDTTSIKNGTTPRKFESTSEKIGTTNSVFESTNPGDGSSPSDSLVKSIIRAAGECKIYFGQPNIPVRMAKIVRAIAEKGSLSVAEMRELTGASRNSVNRDTRILKQMGWIKFNGSRKNGRFTTHPQAPSLFAALIKRGTENKSSFPLFIRR